MQVFIFSRAGIQLVLFIIAFLTFGVADGMSASHMMSVQGASFESNPFARKLYLYAGAEYLIAAKIWLAVILLTAVYLIYRRNKGMYWTINGFLLALIIGGSMAALANIHAATGISYYIDGVIFSYLVVVGVFMGAGCVLDRFYAEDTGYGYARIKENLIGLKGYLRLKR